jgi:hypothetical protein
VSEFKGQLGCVLGIYLLLACAVILAVGLLVGWLLFGGGA